MVIVTSALREGRSALRGAGLDPQKLAIEEDNLTSKLDRQWKTLGKITKRRKMLNKLTKGMDKASSRAASFALVGQAGSQFPRSVFYSGRGLVGSVITIHASPGMSVEDVAIKAREELENMLMDMK